MVVVLLVGTVGPVLAQPDHLVITRIRENGTDEWTEIFNPTQETLTLQSYEEESGLSGNPGYDVSPGGYVIITDSTTETNDGITADISDNSTYSSADEGLKIVSTTTGGDTTTDALGWDKSGNNEVNAEFYESNVFANTGDNWTITRDTDANGVPVDSDDNSSDFYQVGGSGPARSGYSTFSSNEVSVTIDNPGDHADTNVQNVTVEGSTSNASAGDTVELFVNGSSQSIANVQADADSSWSTTGINLSGLRDRVVAELDTNSVDPIADSDAIEVEFSDTNLLHIHNWDMEMAGADPPALRNWEELGTSSSITQDCTISHRSDCSLIFQDLTQTYGGREVASETITIQPGKTYEASGFFRLTSAGSASNADLRIQLAWYDSSGTELSVEPSSGSNLSSTQSWESLQHQATAPSGADRVRVLISAKESSTQGFDVNIDRVTLINRNSVNTTPSVDLTAPDWGDLVKGSTVSGTYVLTDPDDDPGTVSVDVSDDSGSTWSSATISGEIDSVSSSTAGDTHTFNWDSISDLGTVEDTDVKLRIRATDGFDTSSYDTSGAFTVDSRAPPRITDLSSTAAVNGPDSGVHLQWALSNDDVDTYGLYRTFRTGDTSGANLLAEVDSSSDTPYYHDASVTQGDSYYYYVTAVDTAGNVSDSSNRTTAPSLRFTKSADQTSGPPGDTVTYQIEFVNEGFGPTESITIVDALPTRTVLADSAVILNPPPNAQVEYSTDNGTSWQTSSYPRSQIDQTRWIIEENLDPRATGIHGTAQLKVSIE